MFLCEIEMTNNKTKKFEHKSHIRAAWLIECDSHAHLVSKASSVISSSLSDGAAFTAQSA